ncbi:uncharacterized protein LOC123471402 [Daphnia magna]|nr:uncharacterized protein LOC123471402 [Daphnia magna]
MSTPAPRQEASSNKDNRPTRGRVAILVHRAIPYTEIASKNTPNTEAIGITIHNTKYGSIDIFSIYCPKGNCTKEELKQLSSSKNNIIIGGDLNGHHELWGSNQRPNKSGKSLYSTLLEIPTISLITPPQLATYISPSTGRTSTLDITIASTAIANDSVVTLGPFLGSDHIPVVVETKISLKQPTTGPARWKFEESNWHKWNAEINKTLASEKFANCQLPLLIYHQFKEAMIGASHTYFKMTQPSHRTTSEPTKPWWNESSMSSGATHPSATNNHLLSKAGEPITCPNEKATIFLDTFFDRSDTQPAKNKYLEEQIYKAITCNQPNPLNSPITLNEIEESLRHLKSNATGLDLTHNKMITNLNKENREHMRRMFNTLLDHGEVPLEWKESVIIPIPKPNKSPKSPSSYRPISLTSCLGKVMERVIKNRLSCYLESNHLLPPTQAGFRPGRSTLASINM